MTCTNPYVGPRPFEKEDSPFFFGRESEARELLALVQSKPLVLFYAPSGAGKSSLINTRLIPDLQREGFAILPTGRVSGELPEGITDVYNIFIFNLLLKLDQNRSEAEKLTHTTLTDYLQDRPELAVTDKDNTDEKPGYALIIDQFEEIVTTHPERWQDRAEFFHQLSQAMTDDPRLEVVLVLREDYVAAQEPYADILADRLRVRFYMERMGRQAALEAIRKPAEDCERPFAPDVAETLVDNLRRIRVPGKEEHQLGEFVEPVQLQVVCYRLWQNLDLKEPPPTQITSGDLEELGDVDAALAGFYEQVLEKTLHDTASSEIKLRNWFSYQLITEIRTRGTALKGEKETAGLDNTVVESLADQYLLRAETRSGATWYELVHDRFIDPILKANQAWWRRQSSLIRDAQDWDDSGRDAAKLYQGQRLKGAQARIEQVQREPVVTAFLKASRDEDRTRKRQTLIAVALIVALLWLVGAAIFVFIEYRRADSASTKASQAEEVASVAQSTAEAASKDRTEAEEAASVAQSTAEAASKDRAKAEESARTAQSDAAAASKAKAEAEKAAKTAQSDAAAALKDKAEAEKTARAIRTEATSIKLAAAALGNLEQDPELSTRLALHALSAVTYTTEAEDALHRAMQAFPIEYNLVHTDDTDEVLGVWGVAYSPDGRYLATAGRNRSIKIWNAATGEIEIVFPNAHSGGITSVAFSPVDSNRLATGSADRTARVWDFSSDAITPTLTLSGHSNSILGVTFSPDGRHLATASSDTTAIIWDVQTGKPVRTLTGHEGPVAEVAFSPDGGRVATASDDKKARVWDLSSGTTTPALTFTEHRREITSIAFSPDSERIATADWDGLVMIWNAKNGQVERSWVNDASILDIAFSPEGNWLAIAGKDGTAKVWDIESGRELRTFVGHRASVRDVAFSPDGTRLVTASEDGTAKVWYSLGQELLTFRTAQSRTFTIDMSPDDAFVATGGEDGTVRVWGASDGRALRTIKVLGVDGGRVDKVVFSHNGKLLATADSAGDAKIWDLANSTQEPKQRFHQLGIICSVAFSPDDAYLATGISSLNPGDDQVTVWNVETGAEITILPGYRARVVGVAFSPDGGLLATASWDGTTKVFDTRSWKVLKTLTLHEPAGSEVTDVEFSPNGKWLATTGSDKTARLFNLETGELMILSGHADTVERLAFSRDGRRLATASNDGKTKIWDAASGQELLSLRGHTGTVWDVAFNSDATRLVTTGDDGTARFYTLDVETLMKLAEGRVTRKKLSLEECQHFLDQEDLVQICAGK